MGELNQRRSSTKARGGRTAAHRSAGTVDVATPSCAQRHLVLQRFAAARAPLLRGLLQSRSIQRIFHLIAGGRMTLGTSARLAFALVLLSACRAGFESEEPEALIRITPSSMSSPGAWALMDRSLDSG